MRRRSPAFVRGKTRCQRRLTKCRTSAVDCGRLQAAHEQASFREDYGNLGDVGQRRAREDCDRLGREAGGDPGEWVTHAAIHVELRAAGLAIFRRESTLGVSGATGRRWRGCCRRGL